MIRRTFTTRRPETTPAQDRMAQHGAHVMTACILLDRGAECTPAGEWTLLRVKGAEAVKLPTAAVQQAKGRGA